MGVFMPWFQTDGSVDSSIAVNLCHSSAFNNEEHLSLESTSGQANAIASEAYVLVRNHRTYNKILSENNFEY